MKKGKQKKGKQMKTKNIKLNDCFKCVYRPENKKTKTIKFEQNKIKRHPLSISK